MTAAETGIHFIVGVAGPELTADERMLLKELNPAGVIFFASNIANSDDWQDRFRALTADIIQTVGRPKVVLSIDHEGGRVHRLKAPITHFPAASSWGDRSREIGLAMGQELHKLGINLSYAPELDVLTEPSNNVIGDRALSSDPLRVAELGVAYLSGLKEAGILGCGKHFPGHGGTTADSHLERPILDRSADDIYNIDLPPFVSAIAAGLELIMTAHVVYPALDKENTATFSKVILNDLLRGVLKFNGCIVSDALEMKAVSSTANAVMAERFIRAGGDLFLLGQHNGFQSPLERALTIRSTLTKLGEREGEFASLLANSRTRIEKLLSRLN